MYQGYISLVAHTTKKSTYEGMLGREEGRPAYAIRAHSLPSIHGSARERANTLYQPQKKSRLKPKTHLLPIQEKAKRRRRSNAILARDHRTHPDTQINLNKCDLQPALRPRKLLKYWLDHPTQRTRRRREHSDDGAMGAQQAAERRRVRRRVDRAVAQCACGARRRRAVARVGRERRTCSAIRDGL